MIDPNSETLISLAEAARSLPRRRGGKRPHVSCLYRWTTSGCRGVVLESIQVGGTRCTSREALARFFQRLTQDDAADLPPVQPFPRNGKSSKSRKGRISSQINCGGKGNQAAMKASLLNRNSGPGFSNTKRNSFRLNSKLKIVFVVRPNSRHHRQRKTVVQFLSLGHSMTPFTSDIAGSAPACSMFWA